MQKDVEVGSVVAGARNAMGGSGSGVTLLTIADVSRMYTLVNIDETDIAKIRLGQEVAVTVDAFSKEHFTGKVTKIAPRTTTTQNVTTIPVTVGVEAPNLRLEPGMNATCRFIVARHVDVLTVPNAAIQRNGNDITVSVLEHGKPIIYHVQIGIADRTYTEILQGLQEKDLVVTAINDPREQNQIPAASTSSSKSRNNGPPPPMF